MIPDPTLIPLVFDSATIDPIGLKDYLLGFFMALALRRGRIKLLLDNLLPSTDDGSRAGPTEQTEPRDSSDGPTATDDQ